MDKLEIKRLFYTTSPVFYTGQSARWKPMFFWTKWIFNGFVADRHLWESVQILSIPFDFFFYLKKSARNFIWEKYKNFKFLFIMSHTCMTHHFSRDVWAHKTSVTLPLFIEMPVLVCSKNFLYNKPSILYRTVGPLETNVFPDQIDF